MDFKERARKSIISGAAVYKSVFVDYEYLIYSADFKNRDYYIITAEESNYPHMTGVHSLLSAQDFFDRCLDGSLKITEFDFSDIRRSEQEIKGSVKRKIQIIPLLSNLFVNKLQAEEDFIKGKIYCSLATADNRLTIGFIDSSSRPKTLLKYNQLSPSKAVDISLVLKRNKNSEVFDTIIQGSDKELLSLRTCIQ